MFFSPANLKEITKNNNSSIIFFHRKEWGDN